MDSACRNLMCRGPLTLSHTASHKINIVITSVVEVIEVLLHLSHVARCHCTKKKKMKEHRSIFKTLT